MSEIIRTLRAEEAEEFKQFLVRSYGFWPGFMEERYPDRHGTLLEDLECFLVLERDGKIVSHVATFPMDLVVGLARIKCGGVGAVATLPEERGKGYMGRLMRESVKRMNDEGYSLSVLWGDQQRYRTFGYETCGVKYVLHVTQRALQWVGIKPAELRELDPRTRAAVEHVAPRHEALRFRVERPRLALKLQRGDVRLFVGDDDYLVTGKDWGGTMDVKEIYSGSGREASLLLAMMNMTFSGGARVEVGPGQTDVIERLLAVTAGWQAYPQGMFRIINWPMLLRDLQPLLEPAAQGLQPFELSVGCQWEETTTWATLAWDGTSLSVSEGKGAAEAVEMDVQALTAVVLGGPHPHGDKLGPVGRLFPIPLHVPALDHV
ncbi:MAG: GNAT family N-acetyltransferase [Armatimonadetes bacterium]|nr:GNAT family N-acetyltransferase [Armatimonadota bacterium]